MLMASNMMVSKQLKPDELLVVSSMLMSYYDAAGGYKTTSEVTCIKIL